MLFRHAIAVAAISTVAIASAAYAAEGRGDPFPGPDAVIRDNVQNPHYTMGSAAPFNYFYKAKPSPVNGYDGAAAESPYRNPGQVIRVQPTPSWGSHG